MTPEIQQQPLKMWLHAFLPLVLLGILLVFFLKFGPLGVFSSTLVPLENAFIQKVWFSPDHMSIEVFNDGPEAVIIAQVLVNDAYWQFSMLPDTELQPLEHGT